MFDSLVHASGLASICLTQAAFEASFKASVAAFTGTNPADTIIRGYVAGSVVVSSTTMFGPGATMDPDAFASAMGSGATTVFPTLGTVSPNNTRRRPPGPGWSTGHEAQATGQLGGPASELA
eukprot:1195756-Prorocentrum_minimum.AAC.8